MSQRVLLIAYYFPPLGLSGVQRVAKFAKYLPEFGWDVSVLTALPGTYFAYDESLLKEMERPGVTIHRTSSVDPTRIPFKKNIQLPSDSRVRWTSYLSQSLFQPDNKIGWYPFAVRRGKALLAEQEHHAILSSAPPYTAHLIGAELSEISGLPLVVDYRDDWLQNPRHIYPTKWHHNVAQKMETRVFSVARQSISINDPIRYLLSKRSRGLMDADQHGVIPHGFDPEDFSDHAGKPNPDLMEFVYAGVFYDAQKPDTFLNGLARFLAISPRSRSRIRATFLGLFPESSKQLVEKLKIGANVHYGGYVTHPEAIAAIRRADVLWMTIGKRSGASGISTGKLYEYFGSRKPVLGLVPDGVASDSLQNYGAGVIVAPDDPDDVAVAIGKLFNQWESGTLPVPDEAFIAGYDRRELTSQLASILNNVTMSVAE